MCACLQFAVADVEKRNVVDFKKHEVLYHAEGNQLQGAENFQLKNFSDSQHQTHGFISTALFAWDSHIELSIKPDHVWQMVIQGFSSMVAANSEHMRKYFVNFNGKTTIEIQRNGFVLNDPNNDWAGCVDEFEELMNEQLLETTKSKLTAQFSTSNPAEIIASKIGALTVCESYFTYVILTRCGFPSIELQGTVDDWISLKEKVKQLIELDPLFLKWGECLIPVIDRFVDAFNGKVDTLFWDSMIKRNSSRGSGSVSYYNGWIHVFLPYLKDNIPNPHMVPYCESNDYTSEKSGIKISEFPCGVNKAPVIWKYNNLEIPLYFVAGFMGHIINEDRNNISPAISWYVQDQDKYNDWFAK
jgi:hypothetical protein